MVNGESDNWQKLFLDISAVIKKKWNEQNSFDEEGDVAPETVALRNAFNAFPYKTDLFIMDSNDVSTPFGEGRWWTVVKIDFTQPDSSEIIFHGKFPIQELRSGVAIPEAFHLSGSDFDDLAIRGWQEHEFEWVIQILPYLINEKPEEYANELYSWLVSGYPQQFAKRFLKTLDFTELYKLMPDAVKTDADLLERDPDHRYRLGPPTLTRLYEDTRGLILIPQIPESVRGTFGLAKQLHTYAYFEDYFYTVSAHYAYLAVEAGVHARWSESLPQNVTLQYRDDRYDVLSPVHQQIVDIAHERRWKMEKVLVNGQPFPYNTRLLLNWMVAEKIIGKWIRRRLEIAIHMRNAYSHLERAPVAWSCMADLHAASELINIMFHSLPSDKYEE